MSMHTPDAAAALSAADRDDGSAQRAGLFAIDSHAHVFHRGLRFAEPRRYTPDTDAPLERYLAELAANGMTHGVLVQPSFLGTDNSYLLFALASAGRRLRGIAVVEPDSTQEELAALAAAGVVGVRLNLLGTALPDLSAAPWPGFLAAVADLNWQIEVQRPAADAVRLLPALLGCGVNVVLDHFALPDPGLGAADPALDAILRHGATRRLWMKLSAPYRIGANGEAIAHDLYTHLRDALGLDRLVWGSDWPHTRFESEESFARNRAFLDRLVPDPGERAQILDNGRVLFRF